MNLPDKFTPVRFSHLTAYAGVGSIVRDNNDFLMSVVDIRYWKSREGEVIGTPIQNIERIKKHLKTPKDLFMPPVASVRVGASSEIVGYPIPTVIFPGYARCKHCNRLNHKPWYRDEKGISKDLRCSVCSRQGLEQVTWCAVSSAGDLRDVPWHYICHRGKGIKCEPDYSADYLELLSANKGKKRVRCIKCGCSEVFEQINFQSKENIQPWFKEVDNNSDAKLFTVMEINDPRVYASHKERAIVIPPESNVDKNSLASKLDENKEFIKSLKDESRYNKKQKILIRAANYYRCTVQDIIEALNVIEHEKSELKINTTGDMFLDEFKALTDDEKFKEGADFITTNKYHDWKSYINGMKLNNELLAITNLIDRIKSVDRLRVIEAFMGFYRRDGEFDPSEDKVNMIPPDVTGELDWLPAIELFGEGIFFTIDEAILRSWEDNANLRLRAAEVSKRYERSEVGLFNNLSVLSPRFILLHTLSHLIIRELEISSGYPAASLSERIYCSQADGMAGVLIYTAVPDSAGSLGGIVEATEPRNFIKLLDGAFKHAQWCSLDPVCTEHDGQGPGMLNRAACHACVLIPETSCDYGNVFLDRVFIKGSKSLNIPSLLELSGG